MITSHPTIPVFSLPADCNDLYRSLSVAFLFLLPLTPRKSEDKPMKKGADISIKLMIVLALSVSLLIAPGAMPQNNGMDQAFAADKSNGGLGVFGKRSGDTPSAPKKRDDGLGIFSKPKTPSGPQTGSDGLGIFTKPKGGDDTLSIFQRRESRDDGPERRTISNCDLLIFDNILPGEVVPPFREAYHLRSKPVEKGKEYLKFYKEHFLTQPIQVNNKVPNCPNITIFTGKRKNRVIYIYQDRAALMKNSIIRSAWDFLEFIDGHQLRTNTSNKIHRIIYIGHGKERGPNAFFTAEGGGECIGLWGWQEDFHRWHAGHPNPQQYFTNDAVVTFGACLLAAVDPYSGKYAAQVANIHGMVPQYMANIMPEGGKVYAYPNELKIPKNANAELISDISHEGIYPPDGNNGKLWKKFTPGYGNNIRYTLIAVLDYLSTKLDEYKDWALIRKLTDPKDPANDRLVSSATGVISELLINDIEYHHQEFLTIPLEERVNQSIGKEQLVGMKKRVVKLKTYLSTNSELSNKDMIVYLRRPVVIKLRQKIDSKKTEQPVRNATVTITDLRDTFTGNKMTEGEFSILDSGGNQVKQFLPGTYKITVAAPGYDTFEEEFDVPLEISRTPITGGGPV